VSWLTIISIISSGLKLAQAIADIYAEVRAKGAGRTEAIAEALVISHKDISQANAAEEEGRKTHETNPTTDDGFDKRFSRGP